MAFESSDKSGLNNGRKVRMDISNINQSGLKGETVHTDEALLQLIIDNVSNMEVPTGTIDSNKDGKVDVNDLIFNVSEAFKRYAKTQTDKVTLPNLVDALTNGVAVLHSDLSIQKKIATDLQKKLDAVKKEDKGERNPLIYSSGLKTKDKLHPIADIVRETEKEFVQQKDLTGNTTDLAKAISAQPADLHSPIIEYLKAPHHNARTLAETVTNLWILVEDLRKALRSVIYDIDSVPKVARMGGSKTWYIQGNVCNTLLSTAGGLDHNHGNALDIWNESGLQMDPNVPAYRSNNPTPGSELNTKTWYAVIGKTGKSIGQYNRSAPHWRNVGTRCPAEKAQYTNPTDLDGLM